MDIKSVVMPNGTALYGIDLLTTVRHRATRELVIADASIQDADVLFGHLQSGTDLWRVDADTDFSGMLHSAFSCGYERLHFLAHGQPGGIMFAGKVREVEDFTALSGGHQAPSLHFWSCMTGAGAKGRAFVQRLSAAFGSVVTAFSDLVGAESKGGSWLPDVLSSNSGRVVNAPFMNRLAYAHTLEVPSALKLVSVVTATGVDVQVRLTAGTIIDNADLVLSYDPSKASYTGVIGNPALTGWTWLSNPDSAFPGHLLIAGYSLNSINSTSEIVLARISFTPNEGSSDFGASLASGTGLGLSTGNSPVELGTLPILDNIRFSSVPVWESFTPPHDLSYAAGTTVSLDFPVYATDPDGDAVTYKAFVGQMIGTTFFGLAGVPQISLTLSNGHLTGSTTVPAQAAPGSYVLRLLADDNTTDTNNGTALDVPFSVIPPDITIDVNGLPATAPVPASYEKFMDFVLDPAQQGVAGYLASFKVDEDSNGSPVYAFLTDGNNDGVPDHVTDRNGTGTITWDANGIWYAHIPSVTGSEDHYGRFAYDATGDGDVVGLYSFDLTPYTLVTDTNPFDTLVSTFTPSSTESAYLYDDDSNGVIDRMKDVETWTDQSGHSNTNTNNYQLTWTDQTHWTAHYTEKLTFGSTYGANGGPQTIWLDGQEHAITWQTKGADNIVATVNFNTERNGVSVPAVLSFIDSNADDKPDQVLYTDGIDTAHANLVGWTFDENNHPTTVNIVVTSSTNSDDFFSGMVIGSNSNATTILVPSFDNITINTSGSVSGTPQTGEGYYKFYSGTGVVARINGEDFYLDLYPDRDNDPLTFEANWRWLFNSGEVTDTSTGGLTFIDTDTSRPGPELWSATFTVDNGLLLADGSDTDTLPDGFVVGDDMGNKVNVPLVWQPKDANNVIATFSVLAKDENNNDLTFSGVLKDTNGDNQPDNMTATAGTRTFNAPLSFADTNSDGQPDHWIMQTSETFSGRVQVDANGNPAGLYVTWNDIPTKDTLINNVLTFNLGITAPQLADSGYVVVRSANSMGMNGANVPVSALSVNGSWLVVPLSGTDAVTGNPYYLSSYTNSDLFVNVPAGTVVGQTENLFKAWEVGSMSNNAYELSSMPVVHNGAGTDGADWVTGTSGNDMVTAGAGDDVFQWSDGNDVVDAGAGYDIQYLPMTTMMMTTNRLDANGVLHIMAGGGSVTGWIGTDLYRVSKFSDSSYQIQKMDTAGTAVTQTMQLSNAEVLSAGYHPTYLAVQYNTPNGYVYVNGTPWDDTIVLDTVSAATVSSVWGNTGNDVLSMTLAPVYSALEMVNNGSAYVLQGTLAGPIATVVDLGQLTMSTYGGSMTLGTGDNAKSFAVSAIESFMFVSGDVELDFDLSALMPVWSISPQLPPLTFKAGQYVDFSALAEEYDLSIIATDPTNDDITYSALLGRTVGELFGPLVGQYVMPLSEYDGTLQGGLSIPGDAPAGDYVVRLYADDNVNDANPGTVLDVPFTIEAQNIPLPPYWELVNYTPKVYQVNELSAFSVALQAIDPNNDAVTYTAQLGQFDGFNFVPFESQTPIVLTSQNGSLTGSFTVPSDIVYGSYVVRLYADDTPQDSIAGTPFDIPFAVDLAFNITGTVQGSPLNMEAYYPFGAGNTSAGELALAGDSTKPFAIALSGDNDGNPYSFNAKWKIGGLGYNGTLIFYDDNSATLGPDSWWAYSSESDGGTMLADSEDADTLPDGFVVTDDMKNAVEVPLTWQIRADVTGVVATFSATVKNDDDVNITFSGSLKDTDADGLPDRVVGSWGGDAFDQYFSMYDYTGDTIADAWYTYQNNSQSGRVQVDAQGRPAGLYIYQEPGDTPTAEVLNSNELIVDLGDAYDLATLGGGTGSILVQVATPYNGLQEVEIPLSALTKDGSFLTIPLSDTYSIYASDTSSIYVKLPNGTLNDQSADIALARSVGEWQDQGYELAPMAILPNENATDNADWVAGTSGSDAVESNDGNDVVIWSDNGGTVDAGAGDDALYLPMSTNTGMTWWFDDSADKLHITDYAFNANGYGTDLYTVTKGTGVTPTYTIAKMAGASMTLSGAEMLYAGYMPLRLVVNYYTYQDGITTYSSSAEGTFWDDTVALNVANLASYAYVWGNSGYDVLELTFDGTYSAFTVTANGSLWEVKGDGELLATMEVYGTSAYIVTDNGDLYLSDVETLRFTNGSISEVVAVKPIEQVEFSGSDWQNFIYGTTDADPINADALGAANQATTDRDVIEGRDGADTILAGTGNDTVYGNDGNDSIDGGAGNDELRGHAGSDTIDGGAGNDVVVYSGYRNGYSIVNTDGVITVTDIYTDDGDDGTDTLSNVEEICFADKSWYANVLFEPAWNEDAYSFNTITGTAGADTIDANALALAYEAEDSASTDLKTYRDIIDGGAGDDNIHAGDGGDEIKGGAGDDAIHGGASSLLTILSRAVDSWNVENVAVYDGDYSNFDVTLKSNGVFEVSDITDAEGTDTLENIDVIRFGDWSMVRLTPNYYLNWNWTIGTNGEWQATTVLNASADGTAFADAIGLTSDVLAAATSGAYQFTGNDMLRGNEGADTINGGVGDDWLEGGADDDEIDGGDGVDTVMFNGLRNDYEVNHNLDGTITVAVKNTVTEPPTVADGTDTLSNVELLQFWDVVESTQVTFSPALTGGKKAQNSIVGTAGDNSIDADVLAATFEHQNPATTDLKTYRDFIDAGDGNDAVNAGQGGDDIMGGDGNDTIDGGTIVNPFARLSTTYRDNWGLLVDENFALYNGYSSGIDVVQNPNGSFTVTGEGTDTLTNIHGIKFGDGSTMLLMPQYQANWKKGLVNKKITFVSIDNVTGQGTDFNDELGLSSTIQNTANVYQFVGNDALYGNKGDDALYGGAGGDLLQGGAGNDVLDGGADGTSGQEWLDQDVAEYSGVKANYTWSAVTVNDLSTDEQAWFADAITSGVFDSGATVYRIVDSTVGGDGTDLLSNVERLRFSDGEVEVTPKVRVDVWDMDGDGTNDTLYVTGTAQGDEVTFSKLAEITGLSEQALHGMSMYVDLQTGDDSWIGGNSGETVTMDAGNDYLDMAGNVGFDVYGNSMRDLVYFNGAYANYTLLDVTLTKNAGTWSVASSADSSLALSGGTLSSSNKTTLDISDDEFTAMQQGVDKMIANAVGATSVKGWIVIDTAENGTGVDALVGAEVFSFSDKWMPLAVEFYYVKNASGSIESAYAYGTEFADTIKGNSTYNLGGNDWIEGNAGNDSILAGAGGDYINGGVGDDTIDGGANGITDASGYLPTDVALYSGYFADYTISQGTDDYGRKYVTVKDNNVNDSNDGTDTLYNVEHLSFADSWVRLVVESIPASDGSSVWMYGTMLDERIDGSADTYVGKPHYLYGEQGADTLVGGAGPDMFWGGAGADQIIGGANGVDAYGNPGVDVAEYDGLRSNYEVVIQVNGQKVTLDGKEYTASTTAPIVTVKDKTTSEKDTLVGIEAIQFWDETMPLQVMKSYYDYNGDGVADEVVQQGTDSAERITGEDIIDTIYAGKGNDTITGGKSGDTIEGGAGDDVIDGGAHGQDIWGSWRVDVATYKGNYADYQVTTDSNGNVIVKGVHNGADVASGTDTLRNIEMLQFDDKTLSLEVQREKYDFDGDGTLDLVKLTGTDLIADTLAPDSGDVAISHDMKGEAKNDKMTGGKGHDSFTGGAGNDTIAGGDGYDKAFFSGNRADYTFTLPSKTSVPFTVTHKNNGSDGVDTLSGVEELIFADEVVKVLPQVTSKQLDTDGDKQVDLMIWTGTELGDTISGAIDYRYLNHSIEGGKGNDVLTGGDLSDIFIPGLGSDTVYGGSSNDVTANGKQGGDKVQYSGKLDTYEIHNVQTSLVELKGAVQTGNVYTLEVGSTKASHTVAAGDTLATVATKLATAIDTEITNTGFTASAVDGKITLTGSDLIFGVTLSATVSATNKVALSGRFGDVSYDRYVEVTDKNDSLPANTYNKDTLYGIETLVFQDKTVQLVAQCKEKPEIAATIVTGTDYADLLYSTSGNEVFNGGKGSDHIVFADSSGNDQVRGFTAGDNGDVLTVLLGRYDQDGLNGSGIDTVAELMAQATLQGKNTVIDLGAGNSVELVGIALQNLKAANFEVLYLDNFTF